MTLAQQSEALGSKVLSARSMALKWGKPFTVWERGDVFAIASGDPRNDVRSRMFGWTVAAIVTPPQA